MVTRSITNRDKQQDSIAEFWMKLGDLDVTGDDISVYIVKVPTKEQNTPTVKDAKRKEVYL